ncbi:MAG: response regulator transcription factor [Clostridia bacterium]|nr:response regulator transcription factor [Clostridia bacterium]MBQ5757288.1 response regulator transcription factor [Clostridia bacterium]
MQNNIPHILICDDQPVIHETIGAYLDSEGFTHSSAYNGNDAIKLWKEESPDLIILDLMMPGKSGIEVCKEIRATSTVPIIMLTAKGEEIDKVVGLELGADDYIVKPFSTRELISRIKAVLRRSNSPVQENSDVIRIDEIEVNIANYEVRINGKRMDFTPKEVEIFHLLASNPGRVFDREQILSKIWGYDYFGDTRAVDTQIKRIRQKIANEDTKWGIRTVYGVGYKFGVAE